MPPATASKPVLRLDDGQFFDQKDCADAGAALAETYQSAEPFPHIVMENLLPADVLRAVIDEFPSHEGVDFFDRSQERLKYQYHPQACQPHTRHLLAELNSQAFLAFLSAMTGIKGLIADPYFFGGGLHETRRGGHLGVHADFNIHPKMKLVRRINLLIYLNDDWDPSYGGDLELWDRQMKVCQAKVAPLFNRAVVFNTDLDSFHGHPDPLTCPEDRSRRSIAMYYYTSPESGLERLPKRTTVFKARPNSTDKVDWKVKSWHLVKDWVPPAILRALSRG